MDLRFLQMNPINTQSMPSIGLTKPASIPTPIIGSPMYYGSPFLNVPQASPMISSIPFYNPFVPSSVPGSYVYPMQSSNYLFGSGFGMPYYFDYNLYGNNLLGNQNSEQLQPSQERRLCKKSTLEVDTNKNRRDLKEVLGTAIPQDIKDEKSQNSKPLKNDNTQQKNNEKYEIDKNSEIQPKMSEKDVTKKLKLEKKNYEVKTITK